MWFKFYLMHGQLKYHPSMTVSYPVQGLSGTQARSWATWVDIPWTSHQSVTGLTQTDFHTHIHIYRQLLGGVTM